MEWRVYYDDGSTFDSSQGLPHEAPSWGFICAIAYDQDRSRYIMQGWDFYRWDKDTAQWWGMDLVGFIDSSARNENYAVKIGRTVSKKRWGEIMTKAHEDADFPIDRHV